jgi:regulation of enolase protein 1 (concanavalin A-like superfamily)
VLSPVLKQLRSFPRSFGFLFLTLVIGFAEQHPRAAVSGGWTAQDIGLPPLAGTADDTTCTTTNGCPAFTISGSGSGIAGTTDQFMFVHQKLMGDGTIKLRLLALSGTSTVEAGVMVRETLNANARHFTLVTGVSGTSIRSRSAAGGATTSVSVSRGTWLRLDRVGPVLTASISSDGTQWTAVGTQAMTLPSTLYFGIVVTSRSATVRGTASVSSMAVTPTTPTMPSGWSSVDVAPVAPASPGTASYSGGGWVAASYGAGLSGTADAFRLIHTRVRGDAKLSTRVVATQGKPGRQAGIVLRTTLDAGSPSIAVLADEAGVLLVARGGVGQAAIRSRLSTSVAPVFLQMDRKGSLISIAYSLDGVAWTSAATIGVSFGTDLYAGLAVAAGPNGGPAGAAFDRLSLISVAANVPPVVSLASPVNGQTVVVGTSVALAANASDSDDLVTQVDFRVNGTKVASDTASPYSATWTPAATGTYAVTAAATDSDGAVVTSATSTVTVVASASSSSSSSGQLSIGSAPWRVQFGASIDHATLSYYQLEITTLAGLLPVVSKNIGKPAVDALGNCTVDVNTLLLALPLGSYSLVVKSVASTGFTASSPFYFTR